MSLLSSKVRKKKRRVRTCPFRAANLFHARSATLRCNHKWIKIASSFNKWKMFVPVQVTRQNWSQAKFMRCQTSKWDFVRFRTYERVRRSTVSNHAPYLNIRNVQRMRLTLFMLNVPFNSFQESHQWSWFWEFKYTCDILLSRNSPVSVSDHEERLPPTTLNTTGTEYTEWQTAPAPLQEGKFSQVISPGSHQAV